MQSRQQLFHESGHVRSYAIRRVNPFLGVLQVIETVDGRATSTNGVVWDIEVRAEVGGAWGSLNQGSKEVAYYRYGLWSNETGLISRSLASQNHDEPLHEQCQALIECVYERHDQVPFRLVDNRELWLFDSDGKQPIVLLASARSDGPLPSPEPKYWASCIGAHGMESQRRFPGSRELEAMIKQRAGFNINKHWITRQDDGSGVDEKQGGSFRADMFPPFLITPEWTVHDEARLVDEYIDWVSPSLLTLQHLEKPERQRLENTLAIQAKSVEYHWPLYPEVIDVDLLNAARVQSRLQRTNEISEEVS
ncbi:MAG: hypothetical protein OQL16_10815 [Gammaproteobacteria bacterium]|nr:hypothetical protein [Gammaproteobacteria bacterium]